MRALIGATVVVLLALTAACGDDDGDVAVPTGTETSADDQDTEPEDAGTGGDGISEPAAAGEITLTVDGETYSGAIADCQLGDEGPIVITSDGDPHITLNLGRDGDRFGTLNVGVTFEDGRTIGASTIEFEVSVEGDSIEVSSDGFFAPDSGEQLGEGTLRATCA